MQQHGVEREGALRAEVADALRKIRTYARDVEEGQEQERLHLEQVVKMEISNRLSSGEGLRQLLGEAVGQLTAEFDALTKKFEVRGRVAWPAPHVLPL